MIARLALGAKGAHIGRPSNGTEHADLADPGSMEVRANEVSIAAACFA